jgi:DNA repair protein REV1
MFVVGDEEDGLNTSRPFWKVEHIDGLSSMSEVASCSYEARAAGVRNGMFLGPALQLCPTLRTIPYDFPGYEQVSRILYDTVASYTLDIQVCGTVVV